jgi:hypothetical protein
VLVAALRITIGQLGWDGVSEKSWDALRAGLFAQDNAAATNYTSPSSSVPQVLSGFAPAASKAHGRPSTSQRAASSVSLPLLPPKIKPSPLSHEYRVLKSGLLRAEERASMILKELESSLTESDHMIAFDPRWLAHFAESHEEDTGPDQFELAIQKANKMLDFLNQKQREQEACEAMMQQLLDAFNASDDMKDVKDFGQLVRPSTIADCTGDWGGLQQDIDIQVCFFVFLDVLVLRFVSAACVCTKEFEIR